MHKYETVFKNSEVYRPFSYIDIYRRIILKWKLIEFDGVE